jgi:hypothetical protein
MVLEECMANTRSSKRIEAVALDRVGAFEANVLQIWTQHVFNKVSSTALPFQSYRPSALARDHGFCPEERRGKAA